MFTCLLTETFTKEIKPANKKQNSLRIKIFCILYFLFFFMEYIHKSSWIIPFIPLPVPILIGVGLLLFPTTAKNLRRMWAFPSIFFLSIVMIFSVDLSIHQINKSFIYQYVWSWTINNDLSLEFGYLIDSLTSIMSILITTVGILVLIYSDNYMSHDQGYLRF
ncbi:putative polyphosphate kinase [Lupinus albus]|nr:putative polyphosphate kinase [Lupinus albus]